MRKKILVFNGIHGSGKTTLGELLAQQSNRYSFYPEIGRQLRNEVSYNSLQSGVAFDLEVMRRELARDAILLASENTPIIETWHIGNIGYAAARTPQLVSSYTQILSQQLSVFEPIAVYVDIDKDTFTKRATEKNAPDQIEELARFYDVISEKTQSLYKEFGIQTLKIENCESIETALSNLVEGISTIEGGHRRGKERG